MGRAGTLGRALLRSRDSGAFGRSLLSSASLTDVLTLLSASELTEQKLLSSENFSTTSATPSLVPGLTFTPTAGKRYHVEFWIATGSAATTTGAVVEVSAGNCSAGSAIIEVQGGTGAASVIQRGSLAAGAVSATAGTNSTGLTLARGVAKFTADATAPTAFEIRVGTEVAGSAVTVDIYEGYARYRRLVA